MGLKSIVFLRIPTRQVLVLKESSVSPKVVWYYLPNQIITFKKFHKPGDFNKLTNVYIFVCGYKSCQKEWA